MKYFFTLLTSLLAINFIISNHIREWPLSAKQPRIINSSILEKTELKNIYHQEATFSNSACDDDIDCDGVLDLVDQCPYTKPGESVNQKGCSNIELNINSSSGLVVANEQIGNEFLTDIYSYNLLQGECYGRCNVCAIRYAPGDDNYIIFDYNSDGKKDLFAFLWRTGEESVSGNQSDPYGKVVFYDDYLAENSQPQYFDTNILWGGWLDINDYNNDGIYDILLTGNNRHEKNKSTGRQFEDVPFEIFFFNAEGFSERKVIDMEIASSTGPMSGDIDNDGDVDIINPKQWIFDSSDDTPEWRDSRSFVLLNDGQGNFTQDFDFFTEVPGEQERMRKDDHGQILYDINKDGCLDWVLPISNAGAFSVEDGILVEKEIDNGGDSYYNLIYLNGEYVKTGSRIFWGNCSGKFDLSNSTYFDSHQDYLLADFREYNKIWLFGANNFNVFDFNQDGINDIILAKNYHNLATGLQLFKGNADGSYSDVTLNTFDKFFFKNTGDNGLYGYGDFTRIWNIAVKDKDGDGDMDLIPWGTTGFYDANSCWDEWLTGKEYWEFVDGKFYFRYDKDLDGFYDHLQQEQEIEFYELSNKVYGEDPFQLNGRVLLRINGTQTSDQDITFTSSDTDVLKIHGNIATIYKAGTVTVTASKPASEDYFAAEDKLQNLVIAKASLTATASNEGKTYGASNPELTISYTGFVNGDDATDITAPSIATTASATSAVGSYPINLTGGSADNYTLSLEDGKLAVTPAALTATAADKSKTYGDANPILTISYTGFVNGDDATDITAPSIATTVSATSAVGSYPISLTGGSANNYTLSLVNGTLTVTPANLTIQAEDKQINLGEELPTYTLKYEGFVNDEDESVFNSAPTVSSSATAESDRGTYDIIVSGGEADNYAITRVNGVLTITGPVYDLPSELNFDDLILGDEQVKTLTLENTGDGTLNIEEITMPEGYTIDQSTISVAAGASADLSITFTPTEGKSYEELMTITSNNGVEEINLTGTGLLVTNIDDAYLDAEEVKVYPNPASDVLSIDLSNSPAAVANLRLIDIKGGLFWQRKEVKEKQLTVNVSNYQSGTYLLLIETSKGRQVKKIIINN